jgi:hemerythrin superfamily protein
MESAGRNPGAPQRVGQAAKKEAKMATRTRSKSTRGDSSGLGQAGVLAAAAVAGAAVGLAANYTRKLVVQNLAGAAGDWAAALAAEHKAVLALFDKLEATGDEQSWIRAHILTRIRNALGKHALEEENVIYPALREANVAHDADALNAEHGYIKTYLFELDNMPKAGPAWLQRVRDFRFMLEEHMRMEEDEVFPAFRAGLSDEQNAKLSVAMLREGMKLA